MNKKANKKNLAGRFLVAGFFVLLFSFSLLMASPAQALTNVYNKQATSTLTAFEWNNLLTDFISTNGGRIDGPLSINTATSSSYALDIVGSIRATNLSGSFTGFLVASNVSMGNFGSNSGGGNYTFPANLGIGTTNTGSRLLVYDDVAQSLQDANTALRIETPNASGAPGTTGGQITFAQPYLTGNASIIRTGAIRGIKTENSGNYGGGVQLLYNPTGDIDMAAGLTLNHLGNVGIGTTNPTSPLHIKRDVADGVGILRLEGVEPDINFNDTDGGYNTFTFENAGVGKWAFGRNASDNFYIARNNAGWIDDTFNIQRTTGNVGIGTTNPGAKLDVAGAMSINYPIHGISNAGSKTYYNLAAYSYGGGITGAMVIQTNISQDSSVMNQVDVSVYDLTVNGTICTIAIGGYWSTEGNGGFQALGYNSTCTNKYNITIGRNNATGKVAIILANTSYSWSYPKVVVSRATLGHNTIDSDGDNWGISVTNDISGYVNTDVVPDKTLIGGLVQSTAVGVNYFNGGNVGIGTSTPTTAKLVITPSGSYSIDALGGRIGNITSILDTDAASVAYVKAVIAGTSTIPTVGYWTVNGTHIYSANSGGVGIGITNPGIYKLNVNGDTNITGTLTATTFSGSYAGTINSANVSAGNFAANTGLGNFSFPGNVGIGTTNPQVKLEIRSTSDAINAFTSSTGSGNAAVYGEHTGASTGGAYGGMFQATGASVTNFGVYASATGATTNYGVYSAAGTNYFAGNVGIGTTNPFTKLDIVGPSGVTSFTGTTRLGMTIEGSTGATNYVGMDFLGDTGNIGSNPIGRIGAYRTNNGSYLSLGTSNSWVGGITNQALTIDYNGNVGINTTDPGAYKLNVNGNTNITGTLTASTISGSYSGTINAPNVSAGEFASNTGGGNFIFGATVGGNVGIGTTNPAAKLDVNGSIALNGNTLYLHSGTNTYHQIKYGTIGGVADAVGVIFNGAFVAAVGPAGSETAKMTILNNGNVGIGTTNPGGSLDVRGSYSYFGAVQGYTYIVDDQINFGYSNNANYIGNINYAGYLNGATQFRDLAIYNGKGSQIAMFNGSTGNVGINNTNPTTAKLVINPAGSTYAIDAGGARIGPITSSLDTDAASVAYVKAVIAGTSTIPTVGYWTANGTNINNVNSGNVGIGTTVPANKLEIHKAFGGGGLTEGPDLGFTTDNGSESWYTGQISGYIGAGVNNSTSGYPGGLAFKTKIADNNRATVPTTKMVIDAVGNVGINTTNPGVYRLNVNGDTNITGNINVTGTITGGGAYVGTINAGNVSAGAFASNTGLGNFSFPGNVGIGTTNSTAKLQVIGNYTTSNDTAGSELGFGQSTTNPIWGFRVGASPYNLMLNRDLSGTVANVMTWDRNNGNVGIGTTAPGAKLDITGALSLSGSLHGQGNSEAKLFYNLGTYSSDGATGVIVIQTSVPQDDHTMNTTKILVHGQYSDGTKNNCELTLSGYWSSEANGGFSGRGMTNICGDKIRVRYMRQISTGNVAIILGDTTTSWSYPKVSVTEWLAGYSISDSYADGWTITTTADLSGYTNSDDVPDTTAIPSANVTAGTFQNAAYTFQNSVNFPGSGIWNSSGNVGINTTNPGAYRLNVNGDTNITGALNVTGTITGGGAYTGTINAANVSSGTFAANTGGGNFGLLGNMGVGIAVPTAKFQVHGGDMKFSSVANGYLYFGQDGSGTYMEQVGNNTSNENYRLQSSKSGDATNYSQFFIDPTSGFSFMTLGTGNGNVGIGTTNPGAKLHLSGTTDNAMIIDERDWSSKAMIFFREGGSAAYGGYVGYNALADGLQFNTLENNVEKLGIFIDRSTGNVGINTTNPTEAKLVINAGAGMALKAYGNAIFTGTVQTQTGSDFAEEFATPYDLEAGTVVVMDEAGYKSVKPSTASYDKTVVGIVSNNPSIIAGRVESKYKAIIAMMGVVKVKVTGDNGKIYKGDMLTTADREGYAMKADNSKPGTIIGKALENLTDKTGEINVLVNLQ